MPKTHNQKVGQWGEQVAAEHLLSRGCEVIGRNIRTPYGEIDIVAMDGDRLVFIEVKARTQNTRGKPEDFVDVRKQRQLKRVAEGYYHINKLTDQACRFDVIAVDMTKAEPEIRHYKTAFY